MKESEIEELRKKAKAKRKRWKKRNPEWQSSESVIRVFKGLQEGTKIGYITALPWFFTFLNKTPDEVIAERVEQLKSDDLNVRHFYEDVMYDYRDSIVVLHYASQSVIEKMNRAAGFFSRNRVELNLPRAFWDVEESDVAKSRRKTKRYPTHSEIKAIYEVADTNGKISLLLGSQCGLATTDTGQISWANLNIDFEKEKREFVHVILAREKTHVSHVVVFGPDLMYDLRLAWIRAGKPKEGYVFKGYKDASVGPRTVNDWFRKYARVALGPVRAEELSFKDLRDYYNEVLLANNVTAEIKDVLFGHKRKGAKSSYSINVISVVNIYRGIYDDLTVNGGYTQKGKDVKDLEERLEKKLSNQDGLIKTLRGQVAEMEAKLDNQVTVLRLIQERSQKETARQIRRQRKP